jgi:hypothetical protein
MRSLAKGPLKYQNHRSGNGHKANRGSQRRSSVQRAAVRDHIANYRERRAEDVGQNDAPSTKSSRAQQNDEYVEGCNREMKESNVSTRLE